MMTRGRRPRSRSSSIPNLLPFQLPEAPGMYIHTVCRVHGWPRLSTPGNAPFVRTRNGTNKPSRLSLVSTEGSIEMLADKLPTLMRWLQVADDKPGRKLTKSRWLVACITLKKCGALLKQGSVNPSEGHARCQPLVGRCAVSNQSGNQGAFALVLTKSNPNTMIVLFCLR